MTVYKDMKWLPLHLRRQVHLSSYVLKIIKGQSPSNFINKFQFISGAVEMELIATSIHLNQGH